MKIYRIEQRSQQWFDLKQGVMSASGSEKLLGTPAAFNKYVKKTAWEITKKPNDAELQEFLPKSMQRGVDWEDYAYPDLIAYLKRDYPTANILETNPWGFIQISKHFGISPDCLSEDMIIAGEIKVMENELMAQTVFDNIIPKKYYPQVISYFLIPTVQVVHFCGFSPGLENVDGKNRIHVIPVYRNSILSEVSEVTVAMEKAGTTVTDELIRLQGKIAKGEGLIDYYRKKL